MSIGDLVGTEPRRVTPTKPPSIPSTRRDAPFPHWARRAVLGDLVVAALAAVIASVARFGWSAAEHGHTVSYVAVGVIVTFSWPLFQAMSGGYELRTSLFGVEELRRVLRSGVTLLAGFAVAHFMFKLDLSRGYVGVLVPTMIVLTAVWRMILRSATARWMERGRNHHKAVAVGPVADVERVCRQLTRHSSPIDVVAFVADDLDDRETVPPVLQPLQRLVDRASIAEFADERGEIDLLVRAGRPEPGELIVLSHRAHVLGVELAIAPESSDASANMSVSYVPLGATPLLMVETPSLRPTAAAVKSMLDRSMAAVLLVVLSPLLLGIALVIAIREGRPVLFVQQRVGRDGEPFPCLKFRTMAHGAEEQLPGLLDLNEAAGPLFKLRDDPRITGTGRWLRRHSLDELPQLVNVLMGHMSIVGPRPALPREAETFDQRTKRRLLVKPGITGLWQVEGRSDLPWDEGVYLDLMYVDHWSPLLDLVIMARTARVIIRPQGAY